ncbi:MAG: hypothetical protein RL026_1880 [Pseudomonadota bacterium]|jgi:3-deoxy-D-manno-octulosonic acid kinase
METVATHAASFRRRAAVENPRSVLLVSPQAVDLPMAWRTPASGLLPGQPRPVVVAGVGRLWLQVALCRTDWLRFFKPDLWRWHSELRVEPTAEVLKADQLRNAGVDAVAPQAVRYERLGRWYRCQILYSLPDGYRPLMFRTRMNDLPLPQWALLGRTLRRWHEAGVELPGLCATQLHLADEGGEVLVSGASRARFRDPGLWCDAVLVQLRRSLERWADIGRTGFDEACWQCLLSAYG